MNGNRQTKSDLTRLYNLLDDYRNHIITTICTRNPLYNPADVVDDVDEAINMIKIGLW